MSALIVQPFHDDMPCGKEYKYEDAYVAVENEIDKSTSISSGAGTDWAIVVSYAEAILAEHSKDLKLASWWLFGLWKLEGWQGVERGLPLFSDLLNTFTTALYPKSIKVKNRTATWLETALTEEMTADEAAFSKLQRSEELLEQFKALEKGIQLACENEERFCRKVQQLLERTVAEKKAQESKAEVQNTPKPVGTSPAAGASGEPSLTSINSDSDVTKVLQSIKKSADLVANYRRKQGFGSALAIRLNRLQSWLEVDELPANAAGKTMMNPPSESSVDTIETLVAEQEYAAAFEQLERILKFASFWYDGHYMAYKLLTTAGEESAANEVQQALRHFVALYPETLDFTFNDETPFASKETKAWLAVNNSAVKDSSVQEESEEEKRSAVIQQARAAIKKNNIKEAMGLLQSQYIQAGNNIEKFQWRLAHAEIAVECGKKEISLALLEDLEKQIDQHQLDEWQPELASQVYVLYLRSFTRAQVALEKLDAIYGRLCKIDSTLAVDVKY